MTEMKMKGVLRFYALYIQDKHGINYDMASERPWAPDSYIHLSWMCTKALGFTSEETDKGMRWLGFIQGCLFCKGDFNLAELRDHSRGD